MKIIQSNAEKFANQLKYSKEGLVPVVVCSASTGQLLMLAYANKEAVVRTLTSGKAYFFSRSRSELWRKGDTSGNSMFVESMGVDCDKDTLVYNVRVMGSGNACHLGRESCFVPMVGTGKGEAKKLAISKLAEIIDARINSRAVGSYTVKLAKSRKLACAKIHEESEELIEALEKKNKREVAWEACDLIYHALVAARARGVSLSDLEKEFARRHKGK